MTTQELLTKLHSHNITTMAPHVARREGGKLLIESEKEIRRLVKIINNCGFCELPK